MILYIRESMTYGYQKWPIFASNAFSAAIKAWWHLLRGRDVEIFHFNSVP